MRSWIVLGLVATALIGILAYLSVSSKPTMPVEKLVADAPPPPVAPEAPKQPVAAAPSITPPSFDVVRVEPTGELVVGGRGEPSSEMTLLSDGKPLDAAKVGSNGQFAMVPEPLTPGSHDLALSMKMADGTTVLSAQNVAVDVPETKNDPLLVAKTEEGKTTQILAQTTPESSPSPSTPDAVSGRANVAITVVEAEDTGTLYAAGKAAAGASVRLYLNDSYLATADVGPDAAWSLKIAKGVVPGQYKVRVDDVDPTTGKVLSRAEVNFDFVAKVASTAATSTGNTAAIVVDSIETAKVSHGDSLWRISRKIYGSGYRYTVIHQANQKQIRDPDLIFPGQVFVLPKLN